MYAHLPVPYEDVTRGHGPLLDADGCKCGAKPYQTDTQSQFWTRHQADLRARAGTREDFGKDLLHA